MGEGAAGMDGQTRRRPQVEARAGRSGIGSMTRVDWAWGGEVAPWIVLQEATAAARRKTGMEWFACAHIFHAVRSACDLWKVLCACCAGRSGRGCGGASRLELLPSVVWTPRLWLACDARNLLNAIVDNRSLFRHAKQSSSTDHRAHPRACKRPELACHAPNFTLSSADAVRRFVTSNPASSSRTTPHLPADTGNATAPTRLQNTVGAIVKERSLCTGADGGGESAAAHSRPQ